ncbi:MAG: dUTP diphosphatase, partial [Fusobacteriaceae bacterium]
MTIKVKYHNEHPSELCFVGGYDKSCAIDLYSKEDLTIKAGQAALIDLGVSIELPSGYQAMLMPRSSTFKKYGIIQTNSVGLIDESYKGDGDIYMMPVFKPMTALDVVKVLADYTANIFLP